MKCLENLPLKVLLGIGLCFVLSCSEKQAQTTPSTQSWSYYSNVEIPSHLVKLVYAGCLQIQSFASKEITQHRLVASTQNCPENNKAIDETAVRFSVALQPRENGWDIGEKKHELGFIFGNKLVHLCQFSDSEAKEKPFENFFPSYYRSVCEVKLDEQAGLYMGLEKFSVREALAFSDVRAAQAEEEASIAFIQRKTAQDKAQKIEGQVHDLERYRKAEDFIENLQDNMNTLRSALGLSEDATPELIGGEITKLLTQSRTLQREKEDLIARLGLPKDTNFDNLIKALQAIKKADPSS